VTKTFEVLQVLRRRYGVEADALQSVIGGYLHKTWKTLVGMNSLFIKIYTGPDWPEDRIVPTLAAQQRLAAAGLPVPRVILTRDGQMAAAVAVSEPLGTEPSPAVMVVMEYRSGLPLPPEHLPIQSAYDAGAALGKTHRELALLPAGPPMLPDPKAVHREAEAVLAGAEARREPDDMDRLAVEAARFRLQALEMGRLAPAEYDGAVWQWVHGDYYPANLLWDESGQLNGVVDFDFCSPRWRGLEVGRAAVEMGLRSGEAFGWEAARAFLAGYERENPLSPEEKRGVFRLWYNHLISSLYPLTLRYQQGQRLPHGWKELALRRHQLLLWLEQHMAELDRLLAEI